MIINSLEKSELFSLSKTKQFKSHKTCVFAAEYNFEVTADGSGSDQGFKNRIQEIAAN